MAIKMVHAFGHANTPNPHAIENIVTSGLGPHVSVATPEHSAQEVIDRAQQTESNVAHDANTIRDHATVRIPHITASIGHVWTQYETKVIHVGGEVIPWLEHHAGR